MRLKLLASLVAFTLACDQATGYHPPSCKSAEYAMGHTLTPVATFSTPITVPDDGDACNAASVETPFQSLINQTQMLFNNLLNLKVRPSLRSVNGADIVIGSVPMIVGTEGGNWKALAYTGGTYSPAGLANSTWYYLYARIATGSIAISHSTTAPDSYLRTMNGNTDYVYLGAFVTDGAAAIRPFYGRNGETTYGDPVSIVTASPAPAVYTDVALTAGIPPHAQRARVGVRGVSDGRAADTLYLQPKGVITTINTYFNITSSLSGIFFYEMQTDTSRTIQYKMGVGTGSSEYYIYVYGYSE